MHFNHRSLVAIAAATFLATLAPLAAHAGQDHEKDDRDQERRHRIVVDVHEGGPRLWSIGQTGYLGITMIELTPELRAHFGVAEATGVMIASIEEDSPAAAAGLSVGDILTSVDGESIGGSRDVVGAIGPHEEGDVVSLEVFRDSAYTKLEVTLAERKRSQFWLNSLGGPGYSFRGDGSTSWEIHSEDGDENVFVLPGPDSGQLRIQRKKLDEVMGNLHERLNSPDFQTRMFEWRSNTDELESRIEELEQRLKELAAQLEKIDR